MTTDSIDPTPLAQAEVACRGFVATAELWRDFAEQDWARPSGCAKWDQHALAGHIIGEALWFANLAGGVVKGDPPLSEGIYEDLKSLPHVQMADRTETAGREIEELFRAASTHQLNVSVDLGWEKQPLGQAVSTAALEASLHNWDCRVGFDSEAAIPSDVATLLVPTLTRMVSMIAKPIGSGRYDLVVDRFGPVSIQIESGAVHATLDPRPDPDATVLTTDQYVRLLSGRLRGHEFPLSLKQLAEVFTGIANDD
jgi:uncharacterized protein (TIGR03083 family)